MCRSLFGGLGLSAFFILISLGWTSDALARQRPRGAAKVARALTTAEIVSSLKTAHQLLVSADHDYNGHHALAAKEVHKALMELGHRKYPAMGQPGAAVTTGGGAAKKAAHVLGQGAGHEAQAASDAQLRQAQQLLQGALSYINVRHPKAAANVQAAIGEINTALAIK